MIIINGVSYSGNSVTILNNKVIIDGKSVESNDKIINIEVNGNIDSLDVDNCESIKVKGDVGKVKSTNGNVKIEGSVNGDVSTTNGNISCFDVKGSVSTKNGNINKR
jgi:hypothetical protein